MEYNVRKGDSLKVVILAGGFGTRITEESHLKPKPMIEIGGYPILLHIMRLYSNYGFHEFVICGGYKVNVIKEFFANYYLHTSDVTFDFTKGGEQIIHTNIAEPWKVTIIDTGYNTMTGGRIKRIQEYIGDEPFLLTYGDGLCDEDITKVVEFHNKNKRYLTITSVLPGGRFGVMDIGKDGMVDSFLEKDNRDGGWINGGFMVAEPCVFDYIYGDATNFERETIPALVKEKQVDAYRHTGFWQCMDTMRDKEYLETLWASGKAPWVVD